MHLTIRRVRKYYWSSSQANCEWGANKRDRPPNELTLVCHIIKILLLLRTLIWVFSSVSINRAHFDTNLMQKIARNSIPISHRNRR